VSEHDDARNGSRRSYHDEDDTLEIASQAMALAEETANKHAADRRLLEGLDDTVDELRKATVAIRDGNTPWQKSVASELDKLRDGSVRVHHMLEKVTNQLSILQWTKVVWPLTVASFGGGFVAYVVVYLVTR
jgi:hypothetical protein